MIFIWKRHAPTLPECSNPLSFFSCVCQATLHRVPCWAHWQTQAGPDFHTGPGGSESGAKTARKAVT